MLYYLFDYLDKQFDLVGAGVFKYISFRAGMAAAISFLITIMFGKVADQFLKEKAGW
jgi:phospho-N-acetylmuramoyl-pentapeptide-transferase